MEMAEREDGGGTPPNQYRRRGLPKKSLVKDFVNAIGLRATSSSGGKPPSRHTVVDITRHIHGPSPPADTIVPETGSSLECGGARSSHSSRRGGTPTESRLPRAQTHESSDQPDSLDGGMQSLSPDVSAGMVSQRIHISPYSETCFIPYAAQDHIAYCIKGHFHGPYRSWEEVAKAGAVDQWFSVFQDFCLPKLHVDDLKELQSSIPIILCKLERIFPPAFFNSMEHLPVHLAYEALIGGPVQYRWMYPFERCLGNLKHRVLNKARVEGSICNAYLIEETSTFCSYYFESHIPRMGTRVPRNDDGGPIPQDSSLWKIFTYPGRPHGLSKYRYLNDMELQAATLYILLNCDEIKPYITKFVQFLHMMAPNISDIEVDERIEKDFPRWLQNYVSDSANGEVPQMLWDVACGPSRRVECWPVFFVNGYKFWTVAWGEGKSTYNSGVCIKCTGSTNNVETDFYGVVQEIIQLEYPGVPHKNVFLFRCDWFDTTPEHGTRIHKQYKLVDVMFNRRYPKYDPFILASQADQVYYTPYPSKSKDKVGWWAVLKVKRRCIVNYEITEYTEAFQGAVGEQVAQVIHDDPIANLGDSNMGETIDEEAGQTNDVMEEDETEDEDTRSTEDDEESDVELNDSDTEEDDNETDDF